MSATNDNELSSTGAISPRREPAPAAATTSCQDELINILIVDDEPKNLTVLETVLADPSYRLVCAESAERALFALVAEEFALLVLDIRMPDMSGFELAQLIKERKKTAGVPIIFLTAYYGEDEHVLEGYSTGAVDYLQKPINPVILRSKVAVFAELYRKSRESARANGTLSTEVTARRRAEEQLRQLNDELEERVAERTECLLKREREMRSLADNTPDILTRFDPELRYVFVNSAIERATGCPPDAFPGRGMREVGLPDPLCTLWERAPQVCVRHKAAVFSRVRLRGPGRGSAVRHAPGARARPGRPGRVRPRGHGRRHGPEACRGGPQERRPAQGRVPGHPRPRTSQPAGAPAGRASRC